MVVVYKIDRLTRSLLDFAKIVEVFDAHGVSFVSVTQAFNTATSMGRLTLNVLLSFAQFEREVTAERIRDKIAASKKKGMWMGGYPPLGYDVKDRKLVVNETEAETVRCIFRRYQELGSVRLLKEHLDQQAWSASAARRLTADLMEASRLARGALYHMLQNRIYRGEIVHKNQAYPGEHAPIIDEDLWQKVQTTLAANRVDRGADNGNRHVSLLAGLIYDAHGEPMTPSHAVKKGVRYRYYVSKSLVAGGVKADENGSAHSGRSYRGSGHGTNSRLARRSRCRAERSSVSWARRRCPEEAFGRGGAACRFLAGTRCGPAARDPPAIVTKYRFIPTGSM